MKNAFILHKFDKKHKISIVLYSLLSENSEKVFKK